MFKEVYTGLFVGSTILGITGLVQFWQTEGLTRDIALAVGMGGATSALTTVGLGMAYDRKQKNQESDLNEEIQKTELVYKNKLTVLDAEIKDLKATIKTFEASTTEHLNEVNDLKTQLNIKAHQYLTAMAEKDLKVSQLQAITTERDTRIFDFLEDCRQHVISFLTLRNNNLDGIQTAISQGIKQAELPESTRESLGSRLADIKKLRGELVDAIGEIKTIDLTSFKTVLDFIFEFDNKFLNVKVRWKDALVKKIKGETLDLKLALDDSMPKPIAIERFTAGMDEVDVRITEKYEALLLNNNSIHAQLLDLLEQRNLVIDDLQQNNDALHRENKELQKPLLAIGKSDYAVAANRVANYYYDNYGYKLDVINWQETETGFTILFATRKNPGLTEKELLPHNTRQQLAAFTNALHPTLPQFEFNYQHSLLTLEVVQRKPVKKDSAKTDIDAIWIPATKFESHVKRWERVRITAGSTGGKSPTAKNLALAIMNSRKGVGKIRLYDPQHGSKKDYWDMPKAGTSHEDNLQGMKDLCQLIDDRRHGHNHQFVLYIFDEVDNTVTQLKEGAKFRDLIKVSLKEGSHADVGVIYIGQSADANEVPGMTHSNWNNAVQLHIGTNAGTAIEKLTTLTTDDKTKLLNQYRKIQEYCDRMNEELGLDIFTDSGAYRFALAVPLTGLPKFIQLPAFDSYDYSDVMGCSIPTVKPVLEVLNTEIKCPHCASHAIYKNGTNAKGEQYYSCRDCDAKPKKWRLTNTN